MGDIGSNPGTRISLGCGRFAGKQPSLWIRVPWARPNPFVTPAQDSFAALYRSLMDSLYLHVIKITDGVDLYIITLYNVLLLAPQVFEICTVYISFVYECHLL